MLRDVDVGGIIRDVLMSISMLHVVEELKGSGLMVVSVHD